MRSGPTKVIPGTREQPDGGKRFSCRRRLRAVPSEIQREPYETPVVANWKGGQNPTSGVWGTRPPPITPTAKGRRDGWVTILGGLCPPTKRRGFCPTALCLLLLVCVWTAAAAGWGRPDVFFGPDVFGRGRRRLWCVAIVPANAQPLPFGRQAERRLLPMTHLRLCLRMYSG
ncbi:hypothetical protein ES703_15688 [subsurface metagenome]